jgi:hypothetical protein
MGAEGDEVVLACLSSGYMGRTSRSISENLCVRIYWSFDTITDNCGSKGTSSRWAIHLSNMEDAHRLVRHLHMNRFALGHRTDTLLGARILY